MISNGETEKDYFPGAEVFIGASERGRVFLLYRGGQNLIPSVKFVNHG